MSTTGDCFEVCVGHDEGPVGEVPPAVLAYETRLDVTRAEVVRLTGERDAALEHVAYHLRDFRPGADDKATGDLAVDMAAYAGRLKIRADAAEARLRAVEALRSRLATVPDLTREAHDALVWASLELAAALSSDAAPQEVCSYCTSRPGVGVDEDGDPICDGCAEAIAEAVAEEQDDGPDLAPLLAAAAAARAWRKRQAPQAAGVTLAQAWEQGWDASVDAAERCDVAGGDFACGECAACQTPNPYAVADAPAAPEGE